ncbi:MAG TPA: hypothetical protein VLK65_11150 [Vicinamibacteria bacterium]|nr:hypothetical protein [Vicinamibacteria bacterium]
MSAKLCGILVAVMLAIHADQEDEFEDPEQYRTRMLEIDHSFESLEGQSDVRMAPNIEKEASTLIDLFEKVERFWKARGDEDKAGFARMARDGAEKAREAALAKEQNTFVSAVETIAASCEGCHREPLDKYRLRTK